jgi:hypothetical protein
VLVPLFVEGTLLLVVVAVAVEVVVLLVVVVVVVVVVLPTTINSFTLCGEGDIVNDCIASSRRLTGTAVEVGRTPFDDFVATVDFFVVCCFILLSIVVVEVLLSFPFRDIFFVVRTFFFGRRHGKKCI